MARRRRQLAKRMPQSRLVRTSLRRRKASKAMMAPARTTITVLAMCSTMLQKT